LAEKNVTKITNQMNNKDNNGVPEESAG